MKRQLLILSGSALALLLVGTISARTQTQAPATQSAPQAPQAAPQTEVSQEELQQFVDAMQQLQTLQQEYEGKMVQAVQEEGLSRERFLEIRQTERDSSAASTSEVSQEERDRYQKASTRLTELQQEVMTKMKDALQAENLEIERFNQIMAAVQQSPELQQQVQQMTGN